MEKITLTAHDYIPSDRLHALDPLGDSISSLELIRVSGSDLDVVNAARVSYGKVSTELSERDKVLINFLMEHDHTLLLNTISFHFV